MAAEPNASDLIDDREYAAPPELVFEVWTKAEHFARWFAPDDLDVPMCEIDARPGGVIRFQHRVKETGDVVNVHGVFDDVVAPSLIRFTFTFVDDEGRPVAPILFQEWPVGVHIVMTVTMQPSALGTRMTVSQRVLEPEASGLPPVIRHREMAGEGWRETAARLVAYLRNL